VKYGYADNAIHKMLYKICAAEKKAASRNEWLSYVSAARFIGKKYSIENSCMSAL